MRYLFEIGTEELPARELPAALTALDQHFRGALQQHGLHFEGLRALGAPRRLALVIEGVATHTPDVHERRLGPSLQAGFRPDGTPTPAAEGFAKKAGVPVEQLDREETPKGVYLAATLRHPGRAAAVLLADVAGRAFTALPWKRTMRWGWGRLAFARPIHWIVSLLDETVVPCSFGDVQAGRYTCGHRFLAPAALQLDHAAAYETALEAAFVLVDPDRRRERISAGLRDLAQGMDMRLVQDDDLLDEVVHLAEWPHPLIGTFPDRLLDVPREVLITSMRSHQRYFALESASGDLQAAFAFVAGTLTRDDEVVIRGNARVLVARLEDARFFYREDLRHTLESRLASLDRVVFLEGMGSLRQRSERLVRLSERLMALLTASGGAQLQDATPAHVRRAAMLCKADLVTGMVGEFPELQGTMGRYYAQHDQEAVEVAVAIEEHYRPRSAQDGCPQTEAGRVVALADKLDLLASCFALRLQPSASADPYGLRRAALGVLRILEDAGWALPLAKAVDAAIQETGIVPDVDRPAMSGSLVTFIGARLRAFLEGEAAADIIDAVAAVTLDHIAATRRRVRILHSLREEADFEPLALAAKRVNNLLQKEGHLPEEADLEALTEDAERALYDALLNAARACDSAFARGADELAARHLIALKAPVDRFFDEVLVLCEDASVRTRRLVLLRRLRALFLRFADISLVHVAPRTGNTATARRSD